MEKSYIPAIPVLDRIRKLEQERSALEARIKEIEETLVKLRSSDSYKLAPESRPFLEVD